MLIIVLLSTCPVVRLHIHFQKGAKIRVNRGLKLDVKLNAKHNKKGKRKQDKTDTTTLSKKMVWVHAGVVRHCVNRSFWHGTDIISCHFHLEAKKYRKWVYFSFRKARQFLKTTSKVAISRGQIEILAVARKTNANSYVHVK